jgi:hypothetical protein
MTKELNPAIAYMTRIPRSTPAIASRLPKQEDELEEDYLFFYVGSNARALRFIPLPLSSMPRLPSS